MKKTQIFIFTFNRPDLLQKQITCFKKFFIGDHSINVVCDYRDDQFLDSFEKICQKEDVKFYKHKSKSEQQSPSMCHGDVVTWAYDEVITKKHTDDYILFVDHDMFLIDYFDVESYMYGYDICGSIHARGLIRYVWPGLVIFNVEKIKHIKFHFYPCIVNNEVLDTGGGTCDLVNQVSVFEASVEYPDEYNDIKISDKSITNGYNYELYLDQKFLHHRNASNWNNNYIISDNTKTKVLFDILDDIVG